MHTFIRLSSSALVIALVGCNAQVDPQYKGEALAVLTGSVTAREVSLEGPIVPVLGWYDLGQEHDGDPVPGLVQETEVDGDFPNRFTMRVYGPPPDGALFPGREGEPGVAVAKILAARSDMEWDFPRKAGLPKWLVGGSENYFLVYLDGPTLPDGPAARYFGEALPEGYHLLEVEKPSATELEQLDVCLTESYDRAIELYNERHAMDYQSDPDLSDEELEDFDEATEEAEAECGPRLKIAVVPSGIDHPISLHMGTDFEFLELVN